MLDGPSGERVFRIIKTGHKFDVKKDMGAAAHLILVRNEHPAAVVEIVFLADGVSEKLSMSKTVTTNRHNTLAEILTDIRDGRFPTTEEHPERVCPGCPAYFICGPLPAGRFERKT